MDEVRRETNTRRPSARRTAQRVVDSARRVSNNRRIRAQPVEDLARERSARGHIPRLGERGCGEFGVQVRVGGRIQREQVPDPVERARIGLGPATTSVGSRRRAAGRPSGRRAASRASRAHCRMSSRGSVRWAAVDLGLDRLGELAERVANWGCGGFPEEQREMRSPGAPATRSSAFRTPRAARLRASPRSCPASG
jgi:hypothetical protein